MKGALAGEGLREKGKRNPSGKGKRMSPIEPKEYTCPEENWGTAAARKTKKARKRGKKKPKKGATKKTASKKRTIK